MSDAGGSPLVGTDTPGLAVPDVTPVLSDWWNWAARNRADLLGQIAEAGPHTLEELRSAPGDLSNPMLMAFGGPGSIKGFHGTAAPPFDAFSNEFIGSGEGAQAFGWGHYVAGNPKVAEGYQKALAPNLTPAQIAQEYLDAHKGDWDTALREAANDYDKIPHPYTSQAMDILARKEPINAPPPGGSLLEVHILPEESELLDWDKPLSGQPEGVQQKLVQNFGDVLPAGIHTGNDIYKSIAQNPQTWSDSSIGQSNSGGIAQKASEALHSAGIPGIRYLDAGSRNVYPGMSYNGQIKEVPRFVQTFGQGASSPEEVLSAADREIGLMRQKADFAADQYSKSPSARQWPGSRSIQEKEAIDQIADMKKARDFIADNMGDFQYKDPRTFNYVIFDPSNLRITARNGQRLIPVDHDPFAGEGSQ